MFFRVLSMRLALVASTGCAKPCRLFRYKTLNHLRDQRRKDVGYSVTHLLKGRNQRERSKT